MALIYPLGAQSSSIFEDITAMSGISYKGSSWSAGWRDYNNDGFADIWAGNHGGLPTLYINKGNETFIEADNSSINSIVRDGHGVAWADIDNDGDADLIEVVGAALGTGEGGNQLFINNQGEFSDRAKTAGVIDPLGRGRVPLWLDFDNDGLLDLLIVNQTRADRKGPSTLFKNNQGVFSAQSGFDIGKTANDAFAVLSNVSGPLPMELLIFGSRPTSYSPRAFQFKDDRPQEITEEIFRNDVTDVFDAVTADFNGDSRTDIFLSRYKYASRIVEMEEDYYRVGIFNTGAQVRGIDLVSSGDLKLSVHLPTIKWDFSNVFVGKNSVSLQPVNRRILSGDLLISTTDEEVLGEPALPETRKRAVYVWYEPETTTWRLRFTSESWAFLQLEILSSERIDNVKAYGFEPTSPLQPLLLLSRESGYREKFLGKFPSCPSAAAADFDNDMDIDLYLVCTESVANTPNLLYLNDGKGKFTKYKNHGAEGSKIGIGNKAMIADYNNDGFPDIFVTNGLGVVSPINQGPYQLFRNTGNTNHWLKIKLEGTKSNRDGIGAAVLLLAGNKTQLREQNGKTHYGAQDDIILHFGLGSNTLVDKITVLWPSGKIQTLDNIKSNQLLHIKEE